jgi:hypothetical protein
MLPAGRHVDHRNVCRALCVTVSNFPFSRKVGDKSDYAIRTPNPTFIPVLLSGILLRGRNMRHIII